MSGCVLLYCWNYLLPLCHLLDRGSIFSKLPQNDILCRGPYTESFPMNGETEDQNVDNTIVLNLCNPSILVSKLSYFSDEKISLHRFSKAKQNFCVPATEKKGIWDTFKIIINILRNFVTTCFKMTLWDSGQFVGGYVTHGSSPT